MRYGKQYLYRCPNTRCRGAVVAPYAAPAAAVIDWSTPGQRIGDRTVPLKPKTLHRITVGLARHGGPLLVPAGGTRNTTAAPADQPMRARTTTESDALVIPLRNNGVARPANTSPLLAFAVGGTHQGLLYGYDTGTLRPVAMPLPTQTTVEGDALLRGGPDLGDCTFRMLTVEEIRKGMAFSDGYVLLGTTQKAKVRMLGNAVTPPAARDIVAALVEAITGDTIPQAGDGFHGAGACTT